jgi:hypothetical protein
MPAMLRALDGSELRLGDAGPPMPPAVIPPGAPASVAMAVSPVRPGHAVTVDYRVNGPAGPVGYARALRGEFDPQWPFVVAPTYATADKELTWLNRA